MLLRAFLVAFSLVLMVGCSAKQPDRTTCTSHTDAVEATAHVEGVDHSLGADSTPRNEPTASLLPSRSTVALNLVIRKVLGDPDNIMIVAPDGRAMEPKEGTILPPGTEIVTGDGESIELEVQAGTPGRQAGLSFTIARSTAVMLDRLYQHPEAEEQTGVCRMAVKHGDLTQKLHLCDTETGEPLDSYWIWDIKISTPESTNTSGSSGGRRLNPTPPSLH